MLVKNILRIANTFTTPQILMVHILDKIPLKKPTTN